MSSWGREFMWPDEVAGEDGAEGWVSRDAIPDEIEAREFAALDLVVAPDDLVALPVLMREESEVEANINGHEAPYWVECTTRAKHPEPFWRIERRPPPNQEGEQG
jgi:hypothetical protein